MTSLQPSLKKTDLNSPALDELEVCLFGAGFGECIVIHLGYGEWIIVDSCIFRNSSSPAALDYLEKIAVDYSQSVKLIVATHWDDDHIRGIGELVKKCPAARFAMSAAIQDTKFTRIVVDSPLSQAIRLGQKSSTGINEFNTIFHHLKENNKAPKYVLHDTNVWRSLISPNVEVVALSPHSSAFEKAIQSIISRIPSGSSHVGRISPHKPNHTSIVLSVRIGSTRLLLGADLEEHPSHKGWSLIIEDTTPLDEKAEVYKVSHHGSKSGDHESIWNCLLTENVISLIAPWKLGGGYLPKETDISRLLTRTNQVHLSASPQPVKAFKAKDKHARKAMERIKAKHLLQDFSMVRLRKKIGADDKNWECTYFGTASHVPQNT